MALRALSAYHAAVRYAFMATHFGLFIAIVIIAILNAVGKEAPDLMMLFLLPVPGFFIAGYLVPVAILCMINKESKYERGWVEVFYITWQTTWAIAITILNFLAWWPLKSLHKSLQALSVVHTVVCFTWFGWTLWLATRGAELMGPPWTRDLVLRRVGMSKLVRLPQWRGTPDIALDKMDSRA